LKDPRYAKFINKELLEKYYPIGGVRIEDDILVTEEGYENLTTAPKGEEALRIINEDTENVVAEKRKRGWFW
jgi:Xaa-Pro dipeptidase